MTNLMLHKLWFLSFDVVENIFRKVENAGYQHILFQQVLKGGNLDLKCIYIIEFYVKKIYKSSIIKNKITPQNFFCGVSLKG